MNKQRWMIGLNTLNEAVRLYKKMNPIAGIVRLLELDEVMHYKTAYNIIRADRDLQYKSTRPEWLKAEPLVQQAPEGWTLLGGVFNGHWEFDGEQGKHWDYDRELKVWVLTKGSES